MQVQVRTDNHLSGSVELTQEVEELLQDKLRRYGSRVTRVEVHFTDESSAAKSGGDDKRCGLEARLAGLPPVSVSDRGPELRPALRGAIRKLQSLLDGTLGKEEQRGRE